jgi:hypothetical protein
VSANTTSAAAVVVRRAAEAELGAFCLNQRVEQRAVNHRASEDQG